MNMKTAFLNGNLDEEVFIDQPEGFMIEGKEHVVCRLKRSIYELKQASRQWYLKCNDTIISFGFKEIIVDRCIYLKTSGSKFIILVLMLTCKRFDHLEVIGYSDSDFAGCVDT